MSSNLTKFYEVMKKLDDAITDVEKVKEQVKGELDSYLGRVEEELRSRLDGEIKRIIDEYRSSAELSVKREVDEYLSRNRSLMESIKANKDKVINEAVNRILRELGFQ